MTEQNLQTDNEWADVDERNRVDTEPDEDAEYFAARLYLPDPSSYSGWTGWGVRKRIPARRPGNMGLKS